MTPFSYEETKIMFAHALFTERAEREWTQQRLAEAAGVEQESVADIECAVRMPSVHTARKIANGLGMTLSELTKKAGI